MTLPDRPAVARPFGPLAPAPFPPAPADPHLHALLARYGHLLPPWPLGGPTFASAILREAGGLLGPAVLDAAALARSLPGAFRSEAGVSEYDESGFGLTGERGEVTTLQENTQDQTP